MPRISRRSLSSEPECVPQRLGEIAPGADAAHTPKARGGQSHAACTIRARFASPTCRLCNRCTLGPVVAAPYAA